MSWRAPVKGALAGSPCKDFRIAAVIDGDSVSIKQVGDFITELCQHGQIVQSKFFAEPLRIKNKAWRLCLASQNIKFIPVTRNVRPSRDPNDDSICREVRNLLQSDEICAFALMVGDMDYVPLVKEVRGAGKQCMVCLPEHSMGMTSRFERAGASIIVARVKHSTPMPRYMCALRGDGSGGVEPLKIEQPVGNDEADRIDVNLWRLGYRMSSRDPLLPSMAKFWFCNGLGNLIVYPTMYAVNGVAKVFHRHPGAKWVSGQNDVAFVFPVVQTAPTQRVIEAYGTRDCAERVRGGGPFILENSSTLVEEILSKMGFIDTDKNDCVEEGLDTFLELSRNARLMRKAGVSIMQADSLSVKVEKVREVCLSSASAGTFQAPPSDVNVRSHLVACGFLSHESAPWEENSYAMASYLGSIGLTPKRTYSGRVLQCLNAYTRRLKHPQKRRE